MRNVALHDEGFCLFFVFRREDTRKYKYAREEEKEEEEGALTSVAVDWANRQMTVYVTVARRVVCKIVLWKEAEM